VNPKHVLIAGNMGYVGPAVVRRLREAFPNARLTGLDIGYFAHCLTGAAVLPETRLDAQRYVDLRKVTLDELRGVDAVVNLAAISNDPMGTAFEAATHAINFEAGLTLARLAREAGARAFVFASSCSVYGFAEGGPPRRETDALNPLTAYARSKIASEEALQSVADERFSVTCLRFPTACGMSDRLRLDLVLNDFVANAVATGRIDILSDGSPWRPLIDTHDMALAISWAVQRERAQGGAFLAVNVGRNECNYQVKDLARAVAEQMPGTEVRINADAAPDKRSYRVDFSRWKELAPGHLPRLSLGDSIRGLVSGLRAMNFGDASFRESQLMRLRALNAHKASGRLDERLAWVQTSAAAPTARVA
jgi:nucleoside-diphosphate-sugar epimerase